MKKRKTVLQCWGNAAWGLFLCAAVIFSVTFFGVRPLILRVAVSQAETIFLNAANEATENLLSSGKITYDGLAVVSRDEAGYFTGVEIDSVRLDWLKSRLSAEITRLIAEREYDTVSVPIGSLLGSVYTGGIGPRIHFKMQLTATASVRFESEFLSAGINQTLHRIVLRIKVNGSIVLLGCTDGCTVESDQIAAQTVIVGRVPDSFTNVVETPGSDSADDIFNYAQ